MTIENIINNKPHHHTAAQWSILWLAIVLVAFCLPVKADNAQSLEIWRAKASETRVLAENDAPLAYTKAKDLQINLPISATPADQAKALNLLARIEINLALTDLAANHAALALKLATQYDDKIGQAEANLNIALNSVNQARIPDLIAATTRSMSVLEGIDRPDLLGEAMLRTSMMYRRIGQFDESVTLAMQSMEIAQRSNNALAMAYANHGLAISYDQSDHPQEARDYYVKMRNNARAAHSKILQGYALAGLGGVLNKLGDTKGAQSNLQQSIQIFSEVGTPFNVNFSKFGLADILHRQGKYAEAMPLLNEVITTYEKYPNLIGRWYALIARSTNYQSMGNLAASNADARQAYKLAEDIGFLLYMTESAQRMAAITEARGDHKLAYEYSVKANEMAAKASREKSSSRLVELANRYEADSKQRELVNLQQRNQRQAAKLRQHALWQRWLWTVLGTSIAMLIGTVLFMRRLRRSNQMLEVVNTQLKHSQNELQDQTDILQSILNSMGEGVLVANEQGELIMVNPAGEEILGLTPGDAKSWAMRHHLYLPDQTTPYPVDELPLAKAIHGEASDNIEISIANPVTNDKRWLNVTARPLTDKNHAIRGGVALFSDVTARKRAEDQLWESEHKFRTLVEDSPDLFIRYDRECRRIYVSDAYLQIHGRSPEAVLGKRPTEIWGSARMSAAEFESRIRHVMEAGIRSEIELDWYNTKGEYICLWMRVVPEYDRDGKIVSALSITRDISELKRAEKALYLHEQELRSLVENTPDTITRYDQQCRRVYANPRMLADLGMPLEKVINHTPSEIPGGESSMAYEQCIRQVLASGKPEDFELSWKTDEGKQMMSYIRLTPEFGINEEVVSVLAVGRDITEIDEYRQNIHHMAFYDSLTDLPNRALLSDRLHQTIADASWHGHTFGLMLLDLDRFKEVNDTLGHGIGDMILREAAERLLQCVRSYDTVARLGGDEFAILLPQLRGSSDLATIARKIIDVFQQPFHISGRELFISTSIGIALYPSDSAEIDALFKYADSAMYHAKKLGRNNFQFYAKELTARSTERMLMEAELRYAYKNRELELYYQPQVDLATKQIIGAEALIRWNHHERGLIMPGKFITVAEESGLIVSIGEWVLTSACQAAVNWNLGWERPLTIAVNLSIRQFIQNDLVSSVKRILAETQCNPAWIKLEITESLLLEDSESILDVLNAFRDMGLAISIDDFGTGYSALSYLNRFPVKQIKIDHTFVQGIPDDEDKAELVKAMISIAQALRLDLVAEGVETTTQAEYLQAQGCKVVQGYLYGKPMPINIFNKMLADS